MPYAEIVTSVSCSDEVRVLLCKAVSSAVSEVTGKDEAYVMVAFKRAEMTLGGQTVPTAFVDIRGIGGLNRDTNAAITAALCDHIVKFLGVEPAGVYVNFTDVAPSDWGWNGRTFG